MLRQGVRGSDLFRVIFSSGIPMPFWLPVALPKPTCFFSLSPFLITLGIQRQSEVFKSALLRIFFVKVLSHFCVFSATRSYKDNIPVSPSH